jgi:HEAT repeat protein
MEEAEEQQEQKPEITEEELSQARDLFKTFTKSIKTLNVYPKQNPIAQKFLTELFAKFDAFLNKYGDLKLDVEQFSLTYKGKEVFYSDERQDNLPLGLFVDGIREFSFNAGLTAEEMETFIDIFLAAPQEKNPEDDIVTLLWEKELEHISYFVPEDVTDDETTIEEEFLSGAAPGASTETVQGASYSDLTIIPAGIDMEIEPFSDDELRELKAEIGALEPEKLLSATRDIFFELLQSERDISGFAVYVKGLLLLMELWKERQNAGQFLEVIRKAESVLQALGEEEQRTALRKVLERAAEPELLQWFIANSGEKEGMDEYLALIAPYAVDALIHVLAENENRKVRRAICNVLAGIAAKELAPFEKFIKDERWFLVRNIVMILGLSKNPSSLDMVEAALKNQDVRVRRECIKALEILGTDRAGPLLRTLLDDPDSTTRTFAIKALRRFPGQESLEAVTGYISRPDFGKRPFPEKREFLELLGLLGGEQALPLLEKFFRKKSILFGRDDTLELRAAAAYGLGYVPGERAQELLKSESASKRSLLKEACAASLRVSAQRLGKTRQV